MLVVSSASDSVQLSSSLWASEDILALNPPLVYGSRENKGEGLRLLTSEIHYPSPDLAKTRGGFKAQGGFKARISSDCSEI